MPVTLQMTPTDAVSGPEMMKNLREIARWVKLSGTDEEREALGFLERRMADYGFRTRIILHDAYISLPGKARVTVGRKKLNAITHSFSKPSPKGGLTGVPVYLGHGTAADFAGKKLRGKIVLLEGMATPATAKRASEAGAAGQLQISHHEHIHEMCISPVWGNPSRETLSEIPTTVVCSVANADGGAIRDALAAGRKPEVTLHAEVDTGWRKTPILVAELDGPAGGGDEPFIMLSGHHDTWYYGVMDNGSANAGMMEAARLCAAKRDQWQRGLRVCFWSGHSHGRYSGSAWYADAHWDELDRRCAAHVNVDSLGGIGETVLSHAASMAELHHLAAASVRRHSNQDYKGKRKARNSDESFVTIGIPSMFGSISEQPAKHEQARNSLGWWWHTPHDLIDKIDEANQVRDTKVLTEVLWRLLAEPVLPLDHATNAEALLAELTPLAKTLEGRFAVDELIDAAREMRNAARAVHGRAAGAFGPALARAADDSGAALARVADDSGAALARVADDSGAALARVNAALMRVSRAMVPIDYAEGDRFAHPAALPLPNWAVLQPIRDLAATKPGSDGEKFATVGALRARNRVGYALREARDALADASAALG